MPEGDDAPGDAAVEDQLRQARQALSDAEGARNAELSDTVVINRLYYACFHAAQAALYDRGFDPSTHGGVFSPSSDQKSLSPAMPTVRMASS
jgi:hypothetical protein